LGDRHDLSYVPAVGVRSQNSGVRIQKPENHAVCDEH